MFYFGYMRSYQHHTEKQKIAESGWKVRRRVAAAIDDAELEEQRQQDLLLAPQQPLTRGTLLVEMTASPLLAPVLQGIAGGCTYFTPPLRAAEAFRLSKYELCVLRLMAVGLGPAHMAAQLGRSLHSVYTAQRQIRRKLRVDSNAQARVEALAATGLAAWGVHGQVREGGPLGERLARLRDPLRVREALGSAHFCYPGEFARLQRAKGPYELRLRGAFYGKRGRGERPERFMRLDGGPRPGLALSVEDQARGLCLIGPPGSGKSQAGILPICADAMAGGQSLIVLDPQNELGPCLLDYARVTGHLVVIHDPTDPSRPRFNLAEGVAGVPDAQAIARVLVGRGGGGLEDFWDRSARNLLAGCLLRFDSLGAIVRALDDLPGLAAALMARDDGAANLTRAFAAGVGAGDRSAPGVLATLQASTLSAWAERAVQEATAASDFTAGLLVERPTLLLLRCPGRYVRVYGPYLGAVLQRLLLDLDTLGERAPGGALARPVKVVIDEFPLMGHLGGLVEAVNLFRKRRLSIVIAAQTLSQLYGRAGAETLIAGMGTQVFFGSCDAATARFVSTALGRATERPAGRGLPGDPPLRQRDLLSLEEVITPPVGSCTILHRYATPTYATQVVLLASLTPMYRRADWARAVARAAAVEPPLLEPPPFRRGEEADLEAPPRAVAHDGALY